MGRQNPAEARGRPDVGGGDRGREPGRPHRRLRLIRRRPFIRGRSDRAAQRAPTAHTAPGATARVLTGRPTRRDDRRRRQGGRLGRGLAAPGGDAARTRRPGTSAARSRPTGRRCTRRAWTAPSSSGISASIVASGGHSGRGLLRVSFRTTCRSRRRSRSRRTGRASPCVSAGRASASSRRARSRVCGCSGCRTPSPRRRGPQPTE